MAADLSDREMFPARRRERVLIQRLRDLEREGRIGDVLLRLSDEGWEIAQKVDNHVERLGSGPLRQPRQPPLAPPTGHA